MCFNPRTRVGCDPSSQPQPNAPAQFQSTHPRGVRPAAEDQGIQAGFSFNPRTRVGCDLDRQSRDRYPSGFNPRTRVGCDEFIKQIKQEWTMFQSTHPRGVRPRAQVYKLLNKAFQSTHPRGVRLPPTACGNAPRMFQSTHPRGVRRRAGGQRLPGGRVSIHAPAWGATSAR